VSLLGIADLRQADFQARSWLVINLDEPGIKSPQDDPVQGLCRGCGKRLTKRQKNYCGKRCGNRARQRLHRARQAEAKLRPVLRPRPNRGSLEYRIRISVFDADSSRWAETGVEGRADIIEAKLEDELRGARVKRRRRNHLPKDKHDERLGARLRDRGFDSVTMRLSYERGDEQVNDLLEAWPKARFKEFYRRMRAAPRNHLGRAFPPPQKNNKIRLEIVSTDFAKTEDTSDALEAVTT
jgi:hypothetical protein